MTGNILVINPFGIGDVLFSTPLISAIKKVFSGCNISYICNIRTKEILETNPDISEIFVFERDEYRTLWKKSKPECLKKIYDFWSGLKKRHFDIVFDLSLGKEYAFFCWLIGIKDRRGFDYKGRGRFLTKKIPFDGFNDRPIAKYYLELIGNDFDFGMVLRSTIEETGRINSFLDKAGVKESDILIGIAPGGGTAFGREKAQYKRWPWQKFGELAVKIAKCGTRVVILWGPDEEELVRDIKDYEDLQPCPRDESGLRVLVPPRTSIREAAALMKRCRAVVCNDGGMLHIAVSQDVPTVSIFGPTDERVYGPYPASQRHIILKSAADCRPCYKRFKLPECGTKKCLEDIAVKDVLEAISKLKGDR